MGKKNKIKLNGQLRSYLKWPLLLSFLLVAMNVAVYLVNRRAGALMTIFVAVYIALVMVLYYHNRPVLLNELIAFATQYGQVQKSLIRELAVPYALLDAQGRLLWVNRKFSDLTGKEKQYHKSITNIFPEITLDKLPKSDEDTQICLR